MRPLIVLEHISLDGVIQAPGGQSEDTSGGFEHGGWIAPYDDPVVGAALRERMARRFDLLLGRITFDIWSPYWPSHADAWPSVMQATKYVASNTMTYHEWQPSVFFGGDVASEVARIKQESGPELHVWGSSNLVQTLLKHDLVDGFWLMIYPRTLGSGKRLFGDGTIPSAFKVTETIVGPSGIIAVNFERTGPI